MTWQVEALNDVVRAEIKALPDDMRAYFVRISERIIQVGLDKVSETHVRHIEGKLWEMRLMGRDGIARALYVTVTGRRVIVLRVFIKKQRKRPIRKSTLHGSVSRS